MLRSISGNMTKLSDRLHRKLNATTDNLNASLATTTESITRSFLTPENPGNRYRPDRGGTLARGFASVAELKRTLHDKIRGGHHARLRAEALDYYNRLNAYYRWITDLLDAHVVHPIEQVAIYESLVALKRDLFTFLYVESDELFTYHKTLQCWVPKTKALKDRHKIYKEWHDNLYRACVIERIDIDAVQRQLR